MDGVSAAASVLGVIDFSIKSVKGIRDFLSAFKDAPQTVAQLAQDVDVLSTVLERLAQCPLDTSSPATVASLKLHLTTCANTLSSFEALLKSLHPASTSRTDRIRIGLRTVWKDKEIEQVRNRIRDCGAQLNLYLGLLQAEAIAKASLTNASTAEATGNILQQILGEFAKIHDRLDNLGSLTATGEPARSESQDVTATAEPEVMEACSELEESISRLSRLVDNNGSTLDVEDAEHIIDDLERLIKSARDEVSKDRSTLSSPQERAGNEKSRKLRNELRMIEGMVCGAPSIAINPNGPKTILARVPEGIGIKQKRLREEIGIGCGVLTITTNKRRRLVLESSSERSPDKGECQGDVVADLLFRPRNHALTIRISMTQGQLLDHSIQSIPRISVNPIIPRGSPVFEIVNQGRIDEFRVMLAKGEANVRVQDEWGWTLLHSAIKWPEISRLLIGAGLDVDAIASYKDPVDEEYITPLELANFWKYETRCLLLQNGADPLWGRARSPLLLVCNHADASSLRLFRHYGGPFFLSAVDEIDHMGWTMLHQVCSVTGGPRGCTRDALTVLIDAGANVHVRTTKPNRGIGPGSTLLHTLVSFAGHYSTNDELDSLVYLIQQGVSVYAVDNNHRSVSMTAYARSIYKRNDPKRFGGYRGDLWDAALATCGYNILEFRKDYPRLPRYGQGYCRSDFERLWQGIEHLCPYWDDCRWPETGGDSDYYSTDSDDTDSDCSYDGGCELSYLEDGEVDGPVLGRITELSDEEDTGSDGMVEDETSETSRIDPPVTGATFHGYPGEEECRVPSWIDYSEQVEYEDY